MTILHFEYSDFFRRYVEDLVEKTGHQYVYESKGEMLFNHLAHDDIDLIITGMELVDMCGEDLIHDLQTSKFKEIPIIVITSANADNIKRRLKGLKFNDLILKEQLNFDTLAKCIDRIEDTL